MSDMAIFQQLPHFPELILSHESDNAHYRATRSTRSFHLGRGYLKLESAFAARVVHAADQCRFSQTYDGVYLRAHLANYGLLSDRSGCLWFPWKRETAGVGDGIERK